MYNILIFGTGSSCDFFESGMDESRVRNLAYLDNDSTKWGTLKNGCCIKKPAELNNYNYDYIVIASQYTEEIYAQLLELGVDKTKIFQSAKFNDMYMNYVENSVEAYMKSKEDIACILTGISYSQAGLSEHYFKYSIFKFAFASQDLFYDYNIVKYILKNKKSKPRYALIGLSYYCFQYDLSLSAMKHKVVLYNSLLNNPHHFTGVDRINEEYKTNKIIADNILKKSSSSTYSFHWSLIPFRELTNREELGRKQAEIDCSKDYPETVAENKEIFKAYLELLKENDIKPIVIVFPVTKYYAKYFSKRIEDEFHCIMNEMRKEYNFQYIDYFRSDLFSDEDFYDVSHLTEAGAIKFTKMLNDII